MDDVINMVFEICVYLLPWIVFERDLPSFLEIICYAIVIELVKVCCLLEFPFVGNLSGGSSEELQNSIEDSVCVGDSFAVNGYQAPSSKVYFAPETKDVILKPLKPSRIDIVPLVNSEVVYSFCKALNLRAKLVPAESRVVFSQQKRSKKDKIIPVVHSKIVYSICLGLDLEAKLAPVKEGETW
ncbi:hypothetical protein NPIL_160011 [Nephila pilipes]|uniref:Uncharacterized protein n=1 Tax=Nephila pilipes TaxID=299642 RepID=A0A8X6NNN5_NEPPI|nr:hypothetical protein NPIL_160011 [Nephila pilipes]